MANKQISFTKMHGLGNDFILIDTRVQKIRNLQRLVPQLCDRRFGIGADQVLVLAESKRADYRMRIFNADGSEVEMCGNGIRCLAKYIWESEITPPEIRKSDVLSVETPAGIIYPRRDDSMVMVDMGEPVFDPQKIPVKIQTDRVIDYPLRIKNRRFRINCVSMGNPHAVIILDNIDNIDIHTYGPLIEHHDIFPRRINVEFIQIMDRRNIKVRVWERGSGETLACGTGACASAVISCLLGHTVREVTTHLPGGRLKIRWAEDDNHVYMTGPATKVFDGVIDI